MRNTIIRLAILLFVLLPGCQEVSFKVGPQATAPLSNAQTAEAQAAQTQEEEDAEMDEMAAMYGIEPEEQENTSNSWWKTLINTGWGALLGLGASELACEDQKSEGKCRTATTFSLATLGLALSLDF